MKPREIGTQGVFQNQDWLIAQRVSGATGADSSLAFALTNHLVATQKISNKFETIRDVAECIGKTVMQSSGLVHPVTLYDSVGARSLLILFLR